ncbi:hypothetical protein M0812_18516 [Anaeramoeba flamelloides]|uniref:RING-type domain-containing protein n=1 Tax=Anaeramoeba flamelloides TaxID=1746091 RepID=A0AAV7Z8H4_9EUKA|nr:hypothetical protein M0812_18516 [Anaeramoeba flamelloides]
MQSNTTQQNCCICLEKIKVRGRTSCCEHNFCFDCILKWSKIENVCPICRKSFINLYKTKRPFSFNCKIVETINVSPKKQSVKMTEEENLGSFVTSDPSDDYDSDDDDDDDHDHDGDSEHSYSDGIDLGMEIDTFHTINNQQGRCRRSSRLANVELEKKKRLEKIKKNLFHSGIRCEKKSFVESSSQNNKEKNLKNFSHNKCNTNINKKEKEKGNKKKKRNNFNDLNFFIPHINFEDEKKHSYTGNRKNSTILPPTNERVSQLNYLVVEKRKTNNPYQKKSFQQQNLLCQKNTSKVNKLISPLRNLTNQRKRKINFFVKNKENMKKKNERSSEKIHLKNKLRGNCNPNKQNFIIRNNKEKKTQPLNKNQLINSNTNLQALNFNNQNRIFTKRNSLNFIIATKQNTHPSSAPNYIIKQKAKKIRSLGFTQYFDKKK